MKHLIAFSLVLLTSFQVIAQGKLGTLIKRADELNKSMLKASEDAQKYEDSLRLVRPGYETLSNLYYDQSKANMPLPGYYVTAAGDKIEAIIGYQKPQFLIGLSTALFIAKEANGQKIDALNAASDPNFKEWVKYDNIKAFYVANQLFARGTDGNFTVIVTEGAIHTTVSAQMTDQKNQIFTLFPVTQKLNGPKIGSLNNKISEAELLAMMSDAPDIVAGYKSGKYDLNVAEIKYNQWYEENNPGKVQYVLGKNYGGPNQPSASDREASARQKAMVEAAEKANRAPMQDRFAGRPSTAPAAVASAKPEVTVKKESFMDRLNRIKTDGNKVGVLVTCKNLIINPNEFGEGVTKAQVTGSYGPLKNLDKLSSATTQSLNDGFGVDVFESVDYSQIPVKEGNNGKLDDWWATKYKMIVLYEVSPIYEAYYITNTATGEREYKARMKVDADMIVMSAEDEKPDKLKYVTPSTKTWGYYRSDYFVGPSDTNFDIIQELKAAINPPSDEVIIDELIKSQNDPLSKFVSKKSK